MAPDTLTPLPASIPPGSIVDCYLRDSGGEKQDRSIARQLEAVKAYCARHNITLRRIYKDVARSGTTTAGRDEFHRLIADTRDEDKRPHAILLWNYARFARDLDDSTYYKALLRSKRGILIHSLTDNIPEGPYARFVEILIDISNEEKSRQTSIDTRDGLRALVKQGAVPGIPPRGFKREPIVTINPRTGEERKNHRWVPDPKYTSRIRKAFNMRARGASLNEIQKETKLFSTINGYATFWRNKLFIGVLEYGGETYPDYCEPIISKALWEKVQLIQEEFKQSKNLKSGNQRHPRRQASDFILSGIARCSRCGSPLYGRTSHQKTGYKYQSYLCTLAYRKRGACTKGRIPRPAFEAAILNQLKDIILVPENLEEMLRLQTERSAGLASDQADQRREFLSRIAANKKKLANVAEAIEENGLSPTLQTRLASLEHEARELQHELAQLDNQTVPEPEPVTREQIIEYASQARRILESKDPQTQKAFLRGLISHIDVERHENTLRGTIYIYVPDLDNDIITSPGGNTPPNDEEQTPKKGEYVPSPLSPSGPPESNISKGRDKATGN